METRQVFGCLLAVVFAAGGLYGFHFMSQDGVIAILVLPLLAVWIAAGKALVEWLVGNDWAYQRLRATRAQRQEAARAPATKPERQLRREISIPGLIERPGFGWRLLIKAAALAQGLVRSLRAAAKWLAGLR